MEATLGQTGRTRARIQTMRLREPDIPTITLIVDEYSRHGPRLVTFRAPAGQRSRIVHEVCWETPLLP